MNDYILLSLYETLPVIIPKVRASAETRQSDVIVSTHPETATHKSKQPRLKVIIFMSFFDEYRIPSKPTHCVRNLRSNSYSWIKKILTKTRLATKRTAQKKAKQTAQRIISKRFKTNLAPLRWLSSRDQGHRWAAVNQNETLIAFTSQWPWKKDDNLSPFDIGLFFTNNILFRRYISHVMQAYTQFFTRWNFINVAAMALSTKFSIWYRRFYDKTHLQVFFTKKDIFYVWFSQLYFLKDPTKLIPIIQKIFLETHLKKHKPLFTALVTLLNNWYEVLRTQRKIKGYTIFFKGKLGKKGSVKKTKFFSKTGFASLSNKSLRMNYRTYIIMTPTGVVGAGISIFF